MPGESNPDGNLRVAVPHNDEGLLHEIFQRFHKENPYITMAHMVLTHDKTTKIS